MKTSVVVATYNGAKYIIEQLESIKNQTVAADEVLIIEDNSTDNTLEICQNFIEDNDLTCWTIIANEKNIGHIKGFYKGLDIATGDYIFLSDQDDIWRADKIEKMVDVLQSNANILSLSTTFSRITESGAHICDRVQHQCQKRNGLINVPLKHFLCFHSYMGMTMCVSKQLFNLALERGIDYNAPHEVWLNYIAVLERGFYHLDQPLTIRRSYNSLSVSQLNAMQEKKKADPYIYSIMYALKNILIFKSYIDRHIDFYKNSDSNLIQKYIDLYNNRIDILSNRKYMKLLSYSVSFCKYFSIKKFIQDTHYIVLRKNGNGC